MTVRRILLCALLSLCAFSLLASESTCRQGDQITGDGTTGMCGWIEKKPNFTTPSTPYNIMICQADAQQHPPANPAPWPLGPCKGGMTSSSSTVGGYSYWEFDQSAWAYNSIYYIYVWSDADHYGSSTVPTTWVSTPFGPSGTPSCHQPHGASCGVVGVYAYPQPAPLPVSAIYPTDGQQNAPQAFTLKFTTGKDSARNNWTATYDVYAHGMGAPEDTLEASNAPCNPDASGNCQLTIPSVLSNSYIFWHVVAKFPSDFYQGAYLTTSSPQFTFTTLNVPTTAVSFGTNDWAHYLTAFWCGANAMMATATSQGTCESFYVLNQTPHSDGDIYSGDTVALQSTGGYYVQAMMGGGDNVVINGSSPGGYQNFIITKLNSPWATPGTRIMNQDRFSLTSSGGYYVNAYNGGGGAVDACNHSDGYGGSGTCTANTTFNSTNQTFIYYVH